MGCDIHEVIEIWRNGKWHVAVKPISVYERHNYLEGEAYWEAIEADPYDLGRNYMLFGVLAGVREDYEPIKPVRGWPDDVSEETKEFGDDADGHTYHWYTLRELLEYDWDAPITMEGWVSADEYQEFKSMGGPRSWCRGVGGGGVEHVSNAEMEAAIESGDTKGLFTQIMWSKPIRQMCPQVQPFLAALQKLGSPDDVRFLFFFDN